MTQLPQPSAAPLQTSGEQSAPRNRADNPTLQEQLNHIRCHNVLFSDSIPLGDALERMAAAISRTGVITNPESGTVLKKEVNKELGKVLLEALASKPRLVEAVNHTIGPDPTRPVFMKGEAVCVPVHSEMIMISKKDEPSLVFPSTDREDVAAPVK